VKFLFTQMEENFQTLSKPLPMPNTQHTSCRICIFKIIELKWSIIEILVGGAYHCSFTNLQRGLHNRGHVSHKVPNWQHSYRYDTVSLQPLTSTLLDPQFCWASSIIWTLSTWYLHGMSASLPKLGGWFFTLQTLSYVTYSNQSNSRMLTLKPCTTRSFFISLCYCWRS
jgi:hypothetical protein